MQQSEIPAELKELPKCHEILRCDTPKCEAHFSDVVCFLMKTLECRTKTKLGDCLTCEVFKAAQKELPTLDLWEVLTSMRTTPIEIAPPPEVAPEIPNLLVVEDLRLSAMFVQMGINKELKPFNANITVVETLEEMRRAVTQTRPCGVILDGLFPYEENDSNTPPFGIIAAFQLLHAGYPADRITGNSTVPEVRDVLEKLGIRCAEGGAGIKMESGRMAIQNMKPCSLPLPPSSTLPTSNIST